MWRRLLTKFYIFAFMAISPELFFSNAFCQGPGYRGKPTTKPGIKISLKKDREFYQSDVPGKFRIKNITSICISKKGFVYVLGIKDRYVQMFNSDNGKYIKTIKVKGYGYSLCLSVSIHGNVFIADRAANKIWELDKNLNEINKINLVMPKQSIDFLIDQKGNYFLCYLNAGNMVHKFSKQGNFITSFVVPVDVHYLFSTNQAYNKHIERWSASGSISIDNSDNIYYTNLNPYEIRKFTNDGVQIQQFKRDSPFLPPITEYIKPLENNRFLVTRFGGSYNLLVSLKNELIINNLIRPSFQKDGVSPAYYDSALDFFDIDGKYLSTILFEKRLISIAKHEDKYGNIYLLDKTDEPKIVKYKINIK